MISYEAVSASGLTETFNTRVERDAFGRKVDEERNDGLETEISFDRSGGRIRVRTGAGTTFGTGFDGRGRKICSIRPNSRGETTYNDDVDGRLFVRSSTNAGGPTWDTGHVYDSTGRVIRVDHADGTSEHRTYNPDNTIDTRTTRDGIVITHTYGDAKRIRSSVPPGAVPDTLVVLDAGDFYDYDEMSRLTEARRGSAGSAAVDSARTVSYGDYDLMSRPA